MTTAAAQTLADRARRPLSASPRPFLRWAGSKRMLLRQIVDVLPHSYGTYREPFLGGGALFFLLQPPHAVLSDSCADLIATYAAVRDDPTGVLRYLAPLTPDREFFYHVRSNRSRGRMKRAAEFIYLNKTCWNGLYRVNARGDFNVPYGAPKTANLVDEANLRMCSNLLVQPGVECRASDFEAALLDTVAGDLVFLDPPYVTKHNDNGFVDYNELIFSWRDQLRVASVAQRLTSLGAHVLVTNAFHQDILDLYPGFAIRPLDRRSTIASSASKRGNVTEALLWCTAS